MKNQHLNCPSSRPEIPGAEVFAVVSGTVKEPQVHYVDNPIPVNDSLQQTNLPVSLTEVLRISAPCMENRCQYFDGAKCRLAKVISEEGISRKKLSVPFCAIRDTCRWYTERGHDACRMCRYIVTDQPRSQQM